MKSKSDVSYMTVQELLEGVSGHLRKMVDAGERRVLAERGSLDTNSPLS
jgi:hypothetical protein